MLRTLIALLIILPSVISCDLFRQKGEATGPSKLLFADDSLLDMIQRNSADYFIDGAEPVSGMARERIHIDGSYPDNDYSVVTSGGTGFGLMAIIVAIERDFIKRDEGVALISKIISALEGADRYHGAFSHWLYGETGKTKPFSPKDNGGDLVETAYLVQGLLTVRQYLNKDDEVERDLAARADAIWKSVEWDWYTKGEDVLYWHWSPDYGWEMNFPVRGYNECLIMYVLAASSPTHPVAADAYHKGWARDGGINGNSVKFGYSLVLKHNGAEEYGGPLFWSHYSYLGLDPRKLKDKYADYWQHNVNHTLINWKWCSENPKKYAGYSSDCWGLTASYSTAFYAAHAPGENDLGVISPTAALSSMPYTPIQSIAAARHFMFRLGDKIWGKYGFYDAFSVHENWYPQKYLAIDQGPVVVMIENYRTGLLWDLFMSCPEIKDGLTTLGFTY